MTNCNQTSEQAIGAPKRGRPKKGERRITHPYLKANPDFPLGYHKASGQWIKAHPGKRYRFGPDPAEAFERYQFEWPYIIEFKPIPQRGSGEDGILAVGDLINLWLAARAEDVGTRIKRATWDGYREIGRRIIDVLGRHTPVSALSVRDFEKLHRVVERKHPSPSRRRTEIIVSRMPWVTLHASLIY